MGKMDRANLHLENLRYEFFRLGRDMEEMEMTEEQIEKMKKAKEMFCTSYASFNSILEEIEEAN